MMYAGSWGWKKARLRYSRDQNCFRFLMSIRFSRQRILQVGSLFKRTQFHASRMMSDDATPSASLTPVEDSIRQKVAVESLIDLGEDHV